MASEYIIVGDTKDYNGCLVYTCGTSKDLAGDVLNRMHTQPTAEDRRIMETHSNLRIEQVESKDCWWNDPFLAN